MPNYAKATLIYSNVLSNSLEFPFFVNKNNKIAIAPHNTNVTIRIPIRLLTDVSAGQTYDIPIKIGFSTTPSHTENITLSSLLLANSPCASGVKTISSAVALDDVGGGLYGGSLNTPFRGIAAQPSGTEMQLQISLIMQSSSQLPDEYYDKGFVISAINTNVFEFVTDWEPQILSHGADAAQEVVVMNYWAGLDEARRDGDWDKNFEIVQSSAETPYFGVVEITDYVKRTPTAAQYYKNEINSRQYYHCMAYKLLSNQANFYVGIRYDFKRYVSVSESPVFYGFAGSDYLIFSEVSTPASGDWIGASTGLITNNDPIYNKFFWPNPAISTPNPRNIESDYLGTENISNLQFVDNNTLANTIHDFGRFYFLTGTSVSNVDSIFNPYCINNQNHIVAFRHNNEHAGTAYALILWPFGTEFPSEFNKYTPAPSKDSCRITFEESAPTATAPAEQVSDFTATAEAVEGDLFNSADGGCGTFSADSGNVRGFQVPNDFTNGAINLYKLSSGAMAALQDYLWQDDATIWDKFTNVISNAMDCIITLHAIPLSDAQITLQSSTLRILRLGANAVTGGQSPYCKRFQVLEASFNISEYYATALDYSPYTKIKINLPYSGIYELDTDTVMSVGGGNIRCIIDVLSGQMTYIISLSTADTETELYQYYFTGNCKASIPLTGRDYSQIYSSLFMGGINTVANVVGGNALGATAGVAATALEMATAEQKAIVPHSSNVSCEAGWCGAQQVYLIVERPKTHVADNYNTLMGYPSMLTKKLGDLTGITRIAEVHLDNIGNATISELQEIETILKSGVILGES